MIERLLPRYKKAEKEVIVRDVKASQEAVAKSISDLSKVLNNSEVKRDTNEALR